MQRPAAVLLGAVVVLLTTAAVMADWGQAQLAAQGLVLQQLVVYVLIEGSAGPKTNVVPGAANTITAPVVVGGQRPGDWLTQQHDDLGLGHPAVQPAGRIRFLEGYGGYMERGMVWWIVDMWKAGFVACGDTSTFDVPAGVVGSTTCWCGRWHNMLVW
jgi:hypothetical protein